jgi:hypothetical protein
MDKSYLVQFERNNKDKEQIDILIKNLDRDNK